MAAPGVSGWLVLAFKPVFLAPAASLVAALLVGALIIALFRRWWRDDRVAPPDPGEELVRYRALYEQGTISEEEYRALRGLLGGELRRSLDRAKAPPARAEKSTGVQASPDAPSGAEAPSAPADGVRPEE